MPTYEVTTPDGVYHVDSDRELSDAEAQQAVLGQRTQSQESAPETPAIDQNEEGILMPSGRRVKPESGFMSFLREAGTHVIPAVSTALGGAGAGFLASETGPGAIPAAIAGGAAAGTGAQAAQTAIARGLMGEEGYQQELEQEQANRLANPGWTKAGGFLGEAPSMIGAGGGKAGATYLANKATQYLGKRFGPTLGAVLHSGAVGAQLETAGAGERAISGEGHWADVPEAAIHGIVTMGPLGFIPHADGILKSVLLRAPADASTLALSNGLYDYAVHGKPINPVDILGQAGSDIPGFMLLNGVTAFMHGPRVAGNTVAQESNKTAADMAAAAAQGIPTAQEAYEMLANQSMGFFNRIDPATGEPYPVSMERGVGKLPGEELPLPNEVPRVEQNEQGKPPTSEATGEPATEGETASAVPPVAEGAPVGEALGHPETPASETLTPQENATPEGIIPENNQQEHQRVLEGADLSEDQAAIRAGQGTIPGGGGGDVGAQDLIDERAGERLLTDPEYKKLYESGDIEGANRRHAAIVAEETASVQSGEPNTKTKIGALDNEGRLTETEELPHDQAMRKTDLRRKIIDHIINCLGV